MRIEKLVLQLKTDVLIHLNCILRSSFSANMSIILSKSTLRRMSLFILMTAKLDRRSCPIVVRRQFFKRFKHENERSASALETGIAK